LSNGNFLFTSESVTEGHPDKIADNISDAILDAILKQDPTARVACETLVTTGLAVVAGEITTTATVNYKDIIRDTIHEIGYNDASFGYDANTCSVIDAIGTQSPDIAQGDRGCRRSGDPVPDIARVGQWCRRPPNRTPSIAGGDIRWGSRRPGRREHQPGRRYLRRRASDRGFVADISHRGERDEIHREAGT